MPDPEQPVTNDELLARVEQNSTAVSEFQGFILAALKSMNTEKKEDRLDKLIKIGQLVFPILIIWLVYYVNAEIRPIITLQKQNSVLIKEAKEERHKLTARLNAYDVKEARRDVIMENMQKDLRQILDKLQEFKN
jgi:hypothetical protein